MSVPASLAQEKEKKGVYIAAEIGVATIKDYCLESTALVTVTCQDKGAVFGADLGYQFNEYIAAELGGRISSGYGINTASAAGRTKSETDYTSFLFGVRGSLPIGDKFAVHVNTGFNAWNFETKTTGFVNVTTKRSDTDPYYGIGADFSFTDNFDARINYTRIKLSGDENFLNTDIDYISGAVVYRF